MARQRQIARVYRRWIAASGEWDEECFDAVITDGWKMHPDYSRYHAFVTAMEGTPHARQESLADFRCYASYKNPGWENWLDSPFFDEYVQACEDEQRVPTPEGLDAYIAYLEADYDMDGDSILSFREAMDKDD